MYGMAVAAMQNAKTPTVLYERGYQDGFDGTERKDDSTSYLQGYEDGQMSLSMLHIMDDRPERGGNRL